MLRKPQSLGLASVLVSATIRREFPDASQASVDRPKHRSQSSPMHLPANEKCSSASFLGTSVLWAFAFARIDDGLRAIKQGNRNVFCHNPRRRAQPLGA